MSDKKPKKRFGCLKGILYFFLAIALLVVVWLAFNVRSVAGPGQPLVEVSPETTRITQPLDANGDVDFLEAINSRHSDGVTNENNAFVKLFEAIGPLPKDQETSDAVAVELGIHPLPQDGQYFQPFEAWFYEHINKINEQNEAEHVAKIDKEMEEALTEDESLEYSDDEWPEELTVPDNLSDQLIFASQHAWSADDLPEVEKWRQANEPAMAIVREGIQRSHYYYPLVSKGTPKLIHSNLGYTNKCTDIGKCLLVNAMSRLNRNDVAGCIEEIKALHGLASHVSHGSTLIEGLIANNLMSEAVDAMASLCISEKASPEQLKSLLQWVSDLKVNERISERVDQTERFVGLDAAISMARGRDPRSYPADDLAVKLGAFSGIVDSKEVLAQLNSYYDRLVEVASIEDYSELEEGLRTLNDEFVENEKWVMNNVTKSILLGRKSKGIWVGKMLSNMLMPNIRGVLENERGLRARHDMLRIVIAATLFKQDTGAYPSSPEELVPKYLDQLPVDHFSNEPFAWSTENGLQIHSQKWNDRKNGITLDDRLIISAKKITWQEYIADEPDEEFESQKW